LERAAGGGSTPPETPTIRFSSNDRDGVLLKGILAATSGNLVGPNGGRWFFEIQDRLAALEAEIVEQATHATSETTRALAVLGVLSSVDSRKARSPSDALSIMIRPRRPDGINSGIVKFLSEVERDRTAALTIVRNGLTQRKGNGAPSIFDAGAVLGSLAQCARLTELPTELRGETGPRINLRGFHEKQSSAAEASWTPVRSMLGQIGGYVAEGEDLHATLTIMDSFVEQAHRASALANPDAKDTYDRLRAQVTGEQVTALRRLTRLARPTSDAASLWDLASDPVPMLTDILNYWRFCDQLLRSLRDTAPSPSGLSDTYDRARLQRALRALADTLEGLTKQ